MAVFLYNSYRSYLKKKFGVPVLKIPLCAGFSCPNLDGKLSSRGCYFCYNPAFSPVADEKCSPVEQLERGINRYSGRYSRFIAYLQPYTNTYGPLETLQKIYEPLISFRDVVGLSIGTRPDCMDDDLLDYLSDVNRRTCLNIELGLQSTDDSVLRSVNRGHDFMAFRDTVCRLAQRNIETTVHMIIGLPGESKKSIITGAETLSRLPVKGIKLHQLMIIKGTRIEKMYKEGKVIPVELERYAELAGEFISRLRRDQLIHRIAADTHSGAGLIAPLWSLRKLESLNYIRKYFIDNDIFQAKNY